MTGTSVIGLRFEGGIMLAADNLGELSDSDAQHDACNCGKTGQGGAE